MFHFSLPGLFVPAVLVVQPLSAECIFPWERETLPADVVRTALQPDWVFCEAPCDWREQVSGIFRPLVRDCSTAREAVLKIASQMTAVTGVYYSMERRKANMNALEALSEKKVSCTGQSILLVCALRSVGIPARVAWVMSWNHVPGNHTWVEVWVDGDWRMIEFNEHDFNTPWVMEGIGMLNTSRPEQRVYAVAGGSLEKTLPLSCATVSSLEVVDVTARYEQLARQWYAENGHRADCQRVLVDIQPRCDVSEPIELVDEQGKIVARASLPTSCDDVREFASLFLPRTGKHVLRTPTGSRELEATQQPVRIIRLSRE